MEASQVIAGESKYIVPTYIRPDVVFSHGQGVYLYDSQGRQYLDFASGIAVMALGHADETWSKAISEQASKLTQINKKDLDQRKNPTLSPLAEAFTDGPWGH
jgi:acetylornithine/succinyldiaminopimelate/putrescine aminotransferase